jgi:hypothetical protein
MLYSPFSDNTFNLSESFSAVSNLCTMCLAAMPSLLGYKLAQTCCFGTNLATHFAGTHCLYIALFQSAYSTTAFSQSKYSNQVHARGFQRLFRDLGCSHGYDDSSFLCGSGPYLGRHQRNSWCFHFMHAQASCPCCGQCSWRACQVEFSQGGVRQLL